MAKILWNAVILLFNFKDDFKLIPKEHTKTTNFLMEILKLFSFCSNQIIFRSSDYIQYFKIVGLGAEQPYFNTI